MSETTTSVIPSSTYYTGMLSQALEYLQQALGMNDDLIIRHARIANRACTCLFINTICDHKAVEAMLTELHKFEEPPHSPYNLARQLIERVLPASDASFTNDLKTMVESLVTGSFLLLIDDVIPAIAMKAKFVEHRAPEQPYVESSVRGSQISFVENLDVNIGLLRGSLATDTLRVKTLTVGSRSHKKVALVYLSETADPHTVQDIEQRISAIDVPIIGQSADIEQRIVDHPWALFPLTRPLQRIDSAVRYISDGRIMILVDGDPTTLILPATLADSFQTEEDYSYSIYEATFVRMLRWLSFVSALFLPALYIAFVDFNPELLPKVLGVQIAKSREGVPFPAVVEVMIMQTVIEILREATLRMPKQMGQTIGIVGGLVVGEASVQAGIVSNILIIIISLTAVSVFVTPNYSFASVLRLGSWAMIAAASVLGIYGILLMAILMLYEISSLTSFGMPYFNSIKGWATIYNGFLGTLIRVPTPWLDQLQRKRAKQQGNDKGGTNGVDKAK